jgi:hypothetical protein
MKAMHSATELRTPMELAFSENFDVVRVVVVMSCSPITPVDRRQ